MQKKPKTSPPPNLSMKLHLDISEESDAASSCLDNTGVILRNRTDSVFFDWTTVASRLCTVEHIGSYDALTAALGV